MPPQYLTLIPVAPAGAELTCSLYGYTYRVVGKVDGAQVSRFDLSPTYATPFDAVIEAATRGEDATMTATTWRAGVSSAGGCRPCMPSSRVSRPCGLTGSWGRKRRPS